MSNVAASHSMGSPWRQGGWLGPAVLLAALAAIAGAMPSVLPHPTWGWLHLVGKPLATALIGWHAWRRGGQGSPYRRAVLLALAFSWLGDVLLMADSGFLAGLVAFLLAHLCYLVAFTRGVPLARPAWPWLLYGAVALAILAWLWPHLPGGLKLPVAAYVACLAAMAAQALCAARSPGLRASRMGTLARWAAWGGALFMASDALLAIDRFVTPLPLRSVWVLASYWAAQWLMASSIAPRAEPEPAHG